MLYKDKFEDLFRGTWSFDHPTKERGEYLILPFNFSAISPNTKNLESSFINHVRSRTLAFIKKYKGFLDITNSYFRETIEKSMSASDILGVVIDMCKSSEKKLYVVVDEYDNFANTILSTTGSGAYRDLTHGEGFFHSFFNVLKVGTTGLDAPIYRLFLTGVSPLTLDDVTSGYNIGENISIDPQFNRMLGFDRQETEEMVNYYRRIDSFSHETPELMEIITQWYGNYCFSPHSKQGEQLYNSDMVLYFLKEYRKINTIPDELVDRNVRMDYGKLRHF